ncbi:MAG TPA: TIR domain-containing protein [Pyrinomonadaceae bacterium]|jgi:WD40 repeat protein
MSTKSTRVFLSYGRDEYADFAARIKDDLEGRGHQVWFDRERLQSGLDWEAKIDAGIDWVTAAPEPGCMILLMTPHSVRRPDGFCLNEISRALQRRLRIVPVMVAQCEPPLAICRIQWLDMRDCLPLPERLERYRAQFGKLADAVENDSLELEGSHARLLGLLDPLDFKADVEPHLAKFTGRRWVFERVDEWLGQPDASRVFWLVGDPGIGKSAIAAKLVAERAEVVAFHFCQHNNLLKSDPRRVVLSLAFQLSTQFPDYADQLNALNLEGLLKEADAKALFDALLVQPFSRLPRGPGRPCVLVVDAIDESRGAGDAGGLAGFLASEFLKLPRWVRLFVTSRHDPHVSHLLQGFTPYELSAAADENKQNIRDYLRAQLAATARGGADIGPAIETIVERSNGIFLYAERLCDEVRLGRMSLADVGAFPPGLGGIYSAFLQRQFPSEAEYGERVRPVLQVVSAAREPLTLDALQSVLGWDDYERRRLAGSLGGLFKTEGGRLQPFHRTLVDWLTDENKAGQYFISVQEGDRRLADHGRAQLQSGRMSDYTLTYLPWHLARARRPEELKGLLTNFDFVMAKCRAGMGDDLLGDYKAALAADALSADATLRVWAAFFRERIHMLRRAQDDWPADRVLLQLALEHADSSPVTRAAEQALAEGRFAWPRLSLLQRESEVRRNPCLRIFVGHRDGPVNNGIYGALITPDGRLLSWASDGSIRLWHVESGQTLGALSAHAEAVIGLRLLPGGRAVSWSTDGYVKVWDLATQEAVFTSPPHPSLVGALLLDDERILTWCLRGTLRLTSLASGEAVDLTRDHPGAGGALRLSDGRLVTKGENGTLVFWDEDLQPVDAVQAHEHAIRNLVELSDGLVLSSTYQDTPPRVWDSRTGELVFELAGHERSVDGALMLGNGRLATWSFDKTIRLWELTGGQCLHVLEGHSDSVTGARELPDGTLMSWGSDYAARIWDVDDGELLRVIAFGTYQWGLQPSLKLLGDGRVVSLTSDGGVRVWNVDTGELLASLRGHTGSVGGLLEPGEGQLITWGDDNTLRLWEVRPEPSPQYYSAAEARLHGSLPLDEDKFLCWYEGGEAEIWDASRAESVAYLSGHSRDINGAALISGGRLLTWSDDHTVRVWDAARARPLLKLSGHAENVFGAAELSDGRLVSWGADGIRLWETRFGRCLGVLEGHMTGRVEFVQQSVKGVLEHGDRLISWGTDGTIRAWNSLSGSCLKVIGAHTEVVSGVVMAGRRRILSWSSDKTLALWDLADYGQVRVFAGHTGAVDGAMLPSPDRLLSWSHDGSIRLWDVSTGACLRAMETPPGLRTRGAFGNYVRDVSRTSEGHLLARYASGHVALWNPVAGELLEVMSEDEARLYRPWWFAYFGTTQRRGGCAAWSNREQMGVTLAPPQLGGHVYWHSDSDARPVFLHANGTLAASSADRRVMFLAAFRGEGRIALDELSRLLREDARPKASPPARRAAPADAEGDGDDAGQGEQWVNLMDMYPRALADLFVKRGFESAKEGKLKRALEDLNQAIRLDGERADALFYRGRVQLSLSRFEEAVDDFSESLDLEPSLVVALCFRGRAYYELSELGEAAEDFSAALSLDAEEARQHSADALLAMCHHRGGDWAKARAAWTDVIDHSPELAYAYKMRGEARQNLGDAVGAARDMQMYQKLSQAGG